MKLRFPTGRMNTNAQAFFLCFLLIEISLPHTEDADRQV